MTDHVVLYPPGSGGTGGGSFSAGVSTGGNTAGTTGTVSNQIVLVGSNNITLSQSSAAGGATVSIIGGAGGAGFSGGVSNLGNTAGSTGVTGTRLVLAGTNMVSLSQSTDANGGTVSINATQSVQTQDVLSVGLSNIGNTAGNTTVNTGSRLVLSGQANITLSQATAAGATTIGISAPSQTAQTGISSIAASNTTYTSGQVEFTGSNIVTVRSSANQRVVIDASQSVQTQGVPSLGVSTGGNTIGDTGVNSGTRLVLAGGNNITLSQATALNATTITISGGAGGAGMSAGLSTGGNTSGDTGAVTGRLVLAGGNNITLSGSTNGGSMTITVSAPNLGAGGAMSAGASNLGNTAGSTGITGTQLVLVGTGPVSLSQSTGANGGTLSINAPATSSLVATGGGITISTNGSTISLSVPSEAISMWPAQPRSTALSAITATASLFATAATRTTMTTPVFPMAIHGDLSVNLVHLPVQYSATTTVTSQNFSYTGGVSLGLYSLNGNSLSLVSSFSNQLRVSVQSAANSTQASASIQMSYGSGTSLSSSTSFSTNNAFGNTSVWTSATNTKLIPFASGAFGLAGSQYFGVLAVSQSTGGSNLMSLSQVGVVAAASARTYAFLGKAVASTSAPFPLMGFVSMTQTDTGLPTTIATADITQSSNASSWVNRIPAVELASFFYAV